MMKRFWALLLSLMLVWSGGAAGIGSGAAFLPAEDGATYVRVIVELDGAPLMARSNDIGTYAASAEGRAQRQTLERVQQAVQSRMRTNVDTDIAFRYSYTNVINGFSASVQQGDLEKIQNTPGVKAVYRVGGHAHADPQPGDSGKAIMSVGAEMLHADAAYTAGYKGEGMVIAVLDTGIDYTHPMMALSSDDTGKLTQESILTHVQNSDLAAKRLLAHDSGEHGGADKYGKDWYKTAKVPYAFNYAAEKSEFTLYDSYFDAGNFGDQHGMHVAGIAAANNEKAKAPEGFDGVAPEAQVLGMKVFATPDALAYDDDICAALEDAVTLGADVINMSLGAGSASSDPLLNSSAGTLYQAMLDRCGANGVAVITAAGNSMHAGIGNANTGSLPLATNPDTGVVGFPSTYSSAVSVANIEADKVNAQYFLCGDTELYFAEGTNTDAVSFAKTFHNQTVEYAAVPGGGKETDYDGLAVSGKIALVSRGEISFGEKAAYAMSAGAAGILVYNNTPQEGMFTADFDHAGLPGAFVSKETGAVLTAADNKRIRISEDYITAIENQLAGSMNADSSWGPTATLELKPEITAPGGNIYSTLENGKYGVMTGTSMAAPQLAGASALLAQYVSKQDKFSSLSGEARQTLIKQLLMSTAEPVQIPGSGTDGLTGLKYYSPRLQGAGLADISKAIGTEVVLYSGNKQQPKIELGGGLSDSITLPFSAHNFGTETKKYNVSVSVQTDGFAWNSAVNQYVITDDVYAIHADVSATTITAEAQTASGQSLTVTLDPADTAMLSKVFPNGFFVEGFIRLTPTAGTSGPALTIPYLGFHGDWGKAPILDANVYDKDSTPFDTGFGMLTEMDQESIWLGMNAFMQDDTFNSERIAFSPNGDGLADSVFAGGNLLRNVKSYSLAIKDAQGQVVAQEDFTGSSGFLPKSVLDFQTNQSEIRTVATWNGRDENGTVYPDGAYFYTLTVTGEAGNAVETISFPVLLDTQKPTVNNASRVTENGKNVVKASIADNHALQLAALSEDAAGEKMLDQKPYSASAAPQSDTVTLDCSERTGDKLYLTVIDYAQNRQVYEIDLGGGSGGSGGGSGGGSSIKPIDPVSPDKPSGAERFTDVPDSAWYADAVRFVTERGLFNGTGEGKFSPADTMTRAMLITVLARLDGQDTTDGDTWYAKAVAWAKETGVSDGTDLTGMITREQLATMLYRFAGGPAVPNLVLNFADADKVSDWADSALRWAVGQDMNRSKLYGQHKKGPLVGKSKN